MVTWSAVVPVLAPPRDTAEFATRVSASVVTVPLENGRYVSHWGPVYPSSHVHHTPAATAPVAAIEGATAVPVATSSSSPASGHSVPRWLHAARQWVPQSAPVQPSLHWHA